MTLLLKYCTDIQGLWSIQCGVPNWQCTAGLSGDRQREKCCPLYVPASSQGELWRWVFLNPTCIGFKTVMPIVKKAYLLLKNETHRFLLLPFIIYLKTNHFQNIYCNVFFNKFEQNMQVALLLIVHWDRHGKAKNRYL